MSSQTMPSPAAHLRVLLRCSSWQNGEVIICRRQQVTCHTTGEQVTLQTLSIAVGHFQFRSLQELGVQDPVGFWDPLGLAADKDKAQQRGSCKVPHGARET